MDALKDKLSTQRSAFVETAASTGHGVMDALRSLVRMVRTLVSAGGAR